MAKVEIRMILLRSCISNRQIICHICDKLFRKTVLSRKSIGVRLVVDIVGNRRRFLIISPGLCPNCH